MRRWVAAVAVGGVAGLVGAVPVYADAVATISFPGDASELYYRAVTGQKNAVVITTVASAPAIYAIDDVVPISFDAPACRYPDPADPTLVHCARPVSIVDVDTGDLADTIDNRSGLSARLNGGAGNDILNLGEPGLVIGGSGVRHVAGGGPGNDVIIAATRTRDWLVGGPDVDTVSYLGRTAPLTVNLATSSGGERGEGDTVSQFEAIVGGAGADSLTGTDGKNWISGGDGDDRITGNRGPDQLWGDAGADTIAAGPDNDTLHGGPGVDTLDGGTEIDSCHVGADGAWLVPGTCERVS